MVFLFEEEGEGSDMRRRRRRRSKWGATHKEVEIGKRWKKNPLETEDFEGFEATVIMAAREPVNAQEFEKDGKQYWRCPFCKSVCIVYYLLSFIYFPYLCLFILCYNLYICI